METERLIRLPEACRKTGLSRSQIYKLIKEQKFSAPIRIGARAVAFQESLVDAWIQARIAEATGKRDAA